jgi:hypothetical protein
MSWLARKAVAQVLAAICLAAGVSHAQQAEPPGAAERGYIENVLDSLRQHAPEGRKPGLQKVRYVYVDSSDPWIMRAGVVSGAPAIQFSSGAFDLLASLSIARASSIFVKDGAAKYSRWLTYVAGELKEGRYQYRSFAEHSGEKQPVSQYYSPVLQNTFTTLLTYVLAHESAHILLGHTKELGQPISRERARAMELEADLLTVDLTSGIPGNRAQAFLFYATGYKELFLLSAAMNMDILGFESMREHPPEFQRAARMATEYKKKARAAGIKDPKELAMIDEGLDREVSYYERYRLTVEYQAYVNTPGNQVISFDEWRKRFKK